MLSPHRIATPAFEAGWQYTPSYVRINVAGRPALADMLQVVRHAADESPSWLARALLVDLHGVRTRLGHSEQFLLGTEMGRCFAHLDMVAVLRGPAQRSPHGERAARLHGARLRVFEDENEALDWLLGIG